MLNRNHQSDFLGNEAPRILLTDTNRWPTPARLAMGLSETGCRISAICPAGHPLLHTHAVERSFHYSSLRPLQSLIAAIEAVKPHIIVPCDDRGVQHLHELFELCSTKASCSHEIAALIERSLGPSAGYPIVSSRYGLLRLAREEGLRVPDTCPVERLEAEESWREGKGFPWVLKADGTFGGRGVRIAQNQDQMETFLREIGRPYRTTRVAKRLIVNRDPFFLRPWWQRSRPAMIAQAYVPGRPANCAFACWNGNVLAWIGVEVISSEGSTGPATVVRLVDTPEMKLAAERLARRLCLSGFFGLDFMIQNETGFPYLIEMNPRCTPLCHLRLGRGRDLVGALKAQLTGVPMPECPAVTQNPVIAYFPQAWTSKSSLLESSFQDIPQGEPDLVRELLRPWPDRTLLFRLGHALTSTGTTQKSSAV